MVKLKSTLIARILLRSDFSDLPFYSRRNRLAAEILASVFAYQNQICPPGKGNHKSIVATEAMAISREWRATGLAQIMLKHRLTTCRTAGAASVLSVITNLRGQHLARGLGFQVLSEFDFRTAVEREGAVWKPQPDDPKSIQLSCYRFD